MSSNVRLIEAAELATVPYSYGAAVPSGSELLFLAGACPLDSSGRVTFVGDVAEQTASCLANLQTVLARAGARMVDVAFVRVLVASTSRDDLATAWEVVHGAFGDHEVPGTLMGVTVLGWPDQLVEVEAVAAIGG